MFVCVWPMWYRVRAAHIWLVGYDVHDPLSIDREGGVVVVLLVHLLLLRCLKSDERPFSLLGSVRTIGFLFS